MIYLYGIQRNAQTDLRIFCFKYEDKKKKIILISKVKKKKILNSKVKKKIFLNIELRNFFMLC